MKNNRQFKRWNILVEQLNSAERMKDNNIFVSADQEQTKPNGSVISSERKNVQEIETRNTKTIKEIQNNIKNLWED